MGEKAVQSVNTAAYVIQNTATKTIYHSMASGAFAGAINSFLPPDIDVNIINNPASQSSSILFNYGIMPTIKYLLRTNNTQNNKETKK